MLFAKDLILKKKSQEKVDYRQYNKVIAMITQF